MSTQKALHAVAKTTGSAGKFRRVQAWKVLDKCTLPCKISHRTRADAADIGVALVEKMTGRGPGAPLISDLDLMGHVLELSDGGFDLESAEKLNRLLYVALSDSLYESAMAMHVVAAIPEIFNTKIDPDDAECKPWVVKPPQPDFLLPDPEEAAASQVVE
jgi:hypothetical protein